MEYTNWQEDIPDGLKWVNFTSLLNNDFPVFRWAAEAEATGGGLEQRSYEGGGSEGGAEGSS